MNRLLVAAVLVATTHLAGLAQSAAPLQGDLRIVGTDTMKDLLQRWIAAFTAEHPQVHIVLSATGALTAAPALAADAADLVPLGRELTPPELDLFHRSHAYEPTAIPVALGSFDTSGKTVALAFYVNAANPIKQVTFQQLDAMYCTSLRRGAKKTAQRWRDLNVHGTLAEQAVHPIGVNFPDGISNFIRLRVCAAGTFRPDIRAEHTGGPVNVLDRIVADVADDPAAIGYAGFANLKPGTKRLAVSEDGRHFFTGQRSQVAEATYPLTRNIYIFLDRVPGKPLTPAQTAFLTYVLSPAGQALVATDDVYMPLPPNVLASAQKAVR